MSMASKELDRELSELHLTTDPQCNGKNRAEENQGVEDDVQITCFMEDFPDGTLHFQIIRLAKQIYAWIGCNSTKLGHLYAATPIRQNNSVGVTSLLGGGADNTGSSMARRVALRTGLSIILACNIPKDSPMLEAAAERKLLERLRSLGYIRSKHEEISMSPAGPS